LTPSPHTNRLAILSFISGMVALLSISLVFILYNLAAPESVPLFITDGILIPVRNLSVVASLITGVLALRDIRRNPDTEKGKTLAWFGIIVGAGWILFGLLTGLAFLFSGAPR